MLLIIDQKDANLRAKGGRVLLETPGESPRSFAIRQLEQVIIYGNPTIEANLLHALAESGIPTTFFPLRGRKEYALLGNGLATQLPFRKMQHRFAANGEYQKQVAVISSNRNYRDTSYHYWFYVENIKFQMKRQPCFFNNWNPQFDLALGKANIPFVRFADDFLLFASTKQEAEEAKKYAEKQLDRLGLQLHPKKTQIVRSSPKVVFLGEPLPNPNR